MFYFIVMLTMLSPPVCSYFAHISLSQCFKRCRCSVSLHQSVTIHFLLRHVTGATMTSVCRESKHCMTPCECLRSTTDMKTRATSGCRNSSALTHKTSLTRSSWTLPIKSTRGINERVPWVTDVRGISLRSLLLLQWPLKVKGCRNDAGRKWLLCECFGQLHIGIFFEPSSEYFPDHLIHFSHWMSEMLSSDPNPFPANQNMGNYKHTNNIFLAVFTSC